MEWTEDPASLIDSYLPNESSKLDGLDKLILKAKYIDTLSPNPQQISLYYRNIRHKSVLPRASLCIVHGFGEHSGKYINLGSRMALNGIEVHMVDFRNFGYSSGARIKSGLFDLQKDINALLLQVDPNIPCFIYGHSLGGLLVSTILLNNPGMKIAGVILSSALFKSHAEISLLELSIAEFLEPVLKDMIVVPVIGVGMLSRDPFYLKQVIDDTKSIPFCSSKMGTDMMKHLKLVLGEAHCFNYPVLLTHGASDILTVPEGTQTFYENCSSVDKTFKLMAGVRHEAHNDIDRDQFMQELVQWVSDRVEAASHLGKLPMLSIGFPGLKPFPSFGKRVLSFLLLLLVLALIIRRTGYNPISFIKRLLLGK